MSTGPKPPPPPMKKAPPPPPKAAAAPPPPEDPIDEEATTTMENPFEAVAPTEDSVPPVPMGEEEPEAGGFELPSIPPPPPEPEASAMDFEEPAALPMAPPIRRPVGPTAAQLGVNLESIDTEIKKMRRGMSHTMWI